ncbi:hypothetical protein PM082_016218 [Marasmius tenuissimus]|nr:hypothetical protein PM082_016218 [Marasmius tenuissimus]
MLPTHVTTDAVSESSAETTPVEELLECKPSTSASTPDPQDAEWLYDNLTLTPVSHHTSEVAHSPLHCTDHFMPKFTFSGNVLDYEDPWKAVGLVLGLEKPPHSPLKPRNFTAMLAQIPSPDPSVQFSSPRGVRRFRDSLFSGSVSPLDDHEEEVMNDEDTYIGSCLPISQVHDTPLPTTKEMRSIHHRMSSPRSPTSLFSCYSVLEATEEATDVPARDASAYEISPGHSSVEDYGHNVDSHDIEDVQIGEEAERGEAVESEGTYQGSPDKGSCLYAEESDANGTISPENATANQHATYSSIKELLLADEYPPASPSPIPVPRLADHSNPTAGHFDFVSARPSFRTPHAGMYRATRKLTLTPTFDNVTPQGGTLQFPCPATPFHRTLSSKHSISQINSTFDRSNTSVDLQSSRDCYLHIPSPLPLHSRTLQPFASTSSNPRDEQRAVNSTRSSPVIKPRLIPCPTSLDHRSSPSSLVTDDSISQQPALSTLYRPQDASIACASVNDGIMDASGSTTQLPGSSHDCNNTDRDVSMDLTGTAITSEDVGLWKGPSLLDDEDIESD